MPRKRTSPSRNRAWPAIGVRQEPSSTARKARSSGDRSGGVGIVDGGDQRAGLGIVRARLDADRALADGRQELLDVEHRGRRRDKAEAL